MAQPRPAEHAFRTTANALDALPEGEEEVFLARLVLILAEELDDPSKFDECIRRASVVSGVAANTEASTPPAGAAAATTTAPAFTGRP